MAAAKPTHQVRRPPPAVPAAEADAWVKDSKAPRRPGAQAPAADTRGTIRVGRDGVKRKRVHAWIPVDLDRRLAVYCAEKDQELGNVVAAALTKYLK